MPLNDKHKIDIAVGGSHRGRVSNKTTTLRKLREQLSTPSVDASITFAQYQALTVDEKGARKAQAGYIMPGHFRDGIRKRSHQLFRSMVALDLDNVSKRQLRAIREGETPLSRYYWFMHTTRSHSPEKPRVRIFLLLSRNVDADEAYALTRLVAQLLAEDPDEAIEIPDLVSFRFNQVMYLPSISRGQEFWTDENPDAPVIDVDELLESFPTWRDISTLPKQEGEKDGRLSDPNAKMEDPRNKAGLIGAFCRAYTVEDAIEAFLSDIYAPGDSSTETRYTYLHGTASNGAVVYDDGLFLHSHHGSDPAEGLHNAWDLVRIHLFGYKDEGYRGNEDDGPSNLPSFKAMREFAESDEATMVELSAHMAAAFDFDDYEGDDADEDENGDPGEDEDEDEDGASGGDFEFDDYDDEDEDEDEDLIGLPKPKKDKAEKPEKKKKKKVDLSWTANFRRKANGDLEPVLHNVTLICENDPRIADAMAYNRFTHDVVAVRPIRAKGLALPAVPVPPQQKFRLWQDADDVSIRRICSAPGAMGGWEFDPAKNMIEDAVLVASSRQQFHPIQDLILEHHAAWIAAGSPRGRIDRLPMKYLGTEDSPYYRESSRVLLTAICARVFEPGIKFDAVTIIRGKQGGRKSSFWRALGMGFFAELPKDFDRTDRMIEAMRGNLVLEMGEMAGLRKETAEIAKEFITRTEDRHRLAYAKREGTFPRQCVLVGTSNLDTILHDPTGNRRFWIWEDCHSEDDPIDVEALEDEIPLLMGEAYQNYLDMRAERPTGSLHLDLQSAAARRGRDKLAEGYRERTVPEIIAERISEWINTPISGREIEAPGADMFDDLDGDDIDSKWFLRNAICAKDALSALKHDEALGTYRNMDVRTFGKALGYVSELEFIGQFRVGGVSARFYGRPGAGKARFVETSAPKEGMGERLDLEDDGEDLI